MLTSNTKRVFFGVMFFKPIIARWGEAKLADALNLPVKNVRRWIDTDSIPGGWYLRVSRTGIASLEELAAAGTSRDIAQEQKRAGRAHQQDAAA